MERTEREKNKKQKCETQARSKIKREKWKKIKKERQTRKMVENGQKSKGIAQLSREKKKKKGWN